jgi:hypothetical protein
VAGAQSRFLGGFGGAGLVKGKPWDIADERQLRQLVEEGKTVDSICKIMIKTKDAVAQKMFDLKLRCVKEEKTAVSGKKTIFSSSKLNLPKDLPNVEETLQILGLPCWRAPKQG